MGTDSNSRILGIDPGTRFTGIGIVDRTANQLKYIHSETISTKNLDRLEDKLLAIFTRISEVIETFNPQIASIERIFHSVNPRSSLLLGHARGVSILASKLFELEITEYAPNEVKSAVVGAGRASKDQVGAMVQVLLNIDRNIKLKEDESDALAIAICHANTLEFSKIINQVL
jgi:crossover junction endodeoxyribonuclease RuvC